MESTKSVENFKKFLETNCEALRVKVVKAEDILANDEWMQEDQWDEIYMQEKVINGKH